MTITILQAQSLYMPDYPYLHKSLLGISEETGDTIITNPIVDCTGDIATTACGKQYKIVLG